MINISAKIEVVQVLAMLAIFMKATYATPYLSEQLNVTAAENLTTSNLNYGENNDTTVLGEARIILPKLDNNGTSLENVREELELRILDLFGGFSNFEGLGGWKSDDSGILHHEPVWLYDIALPNSPHNNDLLLEMASWLRDEAKQESIYLRFPNGKVNFV